MPNGADVWIEAAPVGTASRGLEGLPGGLEAKDLGPSLEGLAQVVHGAFEKVKPDKATVELAIEVGVESGKLTALWVKGEGKANLKVTLTWGS